ncbi:hypothetical protein EPI10_034380 [Gossypium australe]|uniref:Uncharacterized protein n=1 Tax=Gossypium australe TaxID=47621 RepID=A0A5B6U371_9ROSI|nr:hypothetical protein EPI10_034380 [Gossypium australe]
MRDQIQESQRSMISQLTQLLAEGLEKVKSTVVKSGDDNDDPIYPPGFAPVNTQAQPDAYPQRVPVTIRPQQNQAGTSAPTNYLTGSGSNPGDNPTNPVVPDLDDMAEMEKARVELPNQLEDRWICHVTNMTPKRITLQNMEKKQSESFKQYAQRWREVAMQVQTPLLEKETTMLFINTLKAPFINHMLGSATKSFSDIVMFGEMIENVVRSGKIDAGESSKKSASRKKKNEELYQSMFDAHVVFPFYLKPMQPPFPKWYDVNAQCEYHARITGHSIKNCTTFKNSIVKFYDPSRPNVAGNPLPSHSDKMVNTIIESRWKRTKMNVAGLKTPLKWVWKKMVEGGLTKQDSEDRPERMRNYCEFHDEEGHEIQECVEFRASVQNLMDNKELEFFEYAKGSDGEDVCALEEGSIEKYIKRVPWNYNCSVTILGEENRLVLHKRAKIGRRYNPASTRTKPVKGKTLVVEYKKEKTARIESPVNELVTEQG